MWSTIHEVVRKNSISVLIWVPSQPAVGESLKRSQIIQDICVKVPPHFSAQTDCLWSACPSGCRETRVWTSPLQLSKLLNLPKSRFPVPSWKENQNGIKIARRALWNRARRPRREVTWALLSLGGLWFLDHLLSAGRLPEHLSETTHESLSIGPLNPNNSCLLKDKHFLPHSVNCSSHGQLLTTSWLFVFISPWSTLSLPPELQILKPQINSFLTCTFLHCSLGNTLKSLDLDLMRMKWANGKGRTCLT